MMNSSQTQLSPSESDLELLSAYLDNQLSVAERVSLERRIEADPALRAELEELRETAGALRALEPVRPPRSFTLDPAMVAKPRFYFPLTWVMQMGSGLAGLALVLLATVQILGAGMLPAGAPAPMAAKEAPTEAAASSMMMSDSAPLATQAPAATQAPMMAESAPEAPDAGSAAGSAPAAEAPAADARQAEATAAPAADAGSAAMQAPDAAAQSGGVGGGDPAGGTTGGPFANSPPPGGAGGPPSIDATVDAIQASGSSSPGTADLPPEPAPAPAAAPQGLPPGLTLALGVALIGLGLVWHLRGRRRL